MIQLDFMPQFDGATYEAAQDWARLDKQLDRIRELMIDGRWRTLREIASLTKAPEASVSAQLRNLRKERFGGFTVNHRRREGGIWEYQVR